MGTQQFCLRWNNHQMNMLNVFEQLLQSEDFVDVTLACEGFSIKAHKMVLASCSPYFQSLFKENPCKHPIVILKDMKFSELRLIVDFMYKGEINVSQDQLSTLLKTADALKVKGLAEVSSGAMPSAASATLSHSTSGASGNIAVNAEEVRDIDNVASIEDTSASRSQDAASPSGSQDGPASPHSRRKRHRPNRRPSNSDNDNDPLLPEPSEICFEAVAEPEPKIRPKSEPVELFSEPPVELLMETNPCFEMDPSTDRNNRTQGSSRDMLPVLPSDRLSQPSTSGTQQMSNQDTVAELPELKVSLHDVRQNPSQWDMVDKSGNSSTKAKAHRSHAYTEEDMQTALYSVKHNHMSVSDAARSFGIPYNTIWKRAKKRTSKAEEWIKVPSKAD